VRLDTVQRPDLSLQISPEILQSLSILQMSGEDLQDYLLQLSTENPILELPAQSAPPPSTRCVVGSGTPLFENCEDVSALSALPRLESPMSSSSPEDFLLLQIDEQSLPRDLAENIRLLISFLDDRGFLATPLSEISQATGRTAAALQRARQELCRLEPAGVGAFSLAECLELQLSRQNALTPELKKFIREELPLLDEVSPAQLAKRLKLSAGRLQELLDQLGSLNPDPFAPLRTDPYVPYILPDVIVRQADHHLELEFTSAAFPQVVLRKDYIALLEQQISEESASYIRQKLHQAEWVAQAVEKRGDTLRRLTIYLAQQQQSYLLGNSRTPCPLRMADAARDLDLNISTVSRAAAGKYMQCQQGTLPLSFFFAKSLPNQAAGVSEVMQQLRDIVQGEDAAHPLSDSQLHSILEQRGYRVARRTVAKYRGILRIPSAELRTR